MVGVRADLATAIELMCRMIDWGKGYRYLHEKHGVDHAYSDTLFAQFNMGKHLRHMRRGNYPWHQPSRGSMADIVKKMCAVPVHLQRNFIPREEDMPTMDEVHGYYAAVQNFPARGTNTRLIQYAVA
jgi:hypothetical protein